MATTEFYGSESTDERYQQSSGPLVIVQVHEADVWPVHDNATITKDSLLTAAGAYNGVHPVVAIGGRTAADGRPLNLTGVVVDVTPSSTLAESLVRVNIADGQVVRNWVANILTYAGTNPATFEQAPVIGQPVYVDDSQALAAGVTLSMSPLSGGGLRNPLAGHLFYCQDEYADDMVGGANTATTFDNTLANSLVEQEYCIILSNGWRELA
jgi:hypothetical protein